MGGIEGTANGGTIETYDTEGNNMKSKDIMVRFAGFVMLGLALAGCQTTAPKADNRHRFYDSALADVIIQFNRWDTIHILRPEIREGGFLPILTRTDFERELMAHSLGRQLAVVVLGFLFPPDLEAQYAREWDAVLSAQGFQRVVVLRTGMSKTTDGLLVVHDSSIGDIHEPTAVAKTKDPALPSSAGANASNSSSR